MAEEKRPDPLLQLRQAIASSSLSVPSTSESVDTPTDNLAVATHLAFTAPSAVAYPLATETRFVSSAGKAVDLRSIWFAWQHKDDPIPDYIASTQTLNEGLAADGGAGGEVQNLAFVERLDLITWLEGASNESEYIKALVGDAQQAPVAAATATEAQRPKRALSPSLEEIIKSERRLGDRNKALRGIVPTDLTNVRKLAEIYLRTNRQMAKAGVAPGTQSLATHQKPKTGRRPDPIILLSPSASSLLRMSNIKSFLNDGEYTPPDNSSLAATTSILHVSRLLPSVDSQRPLRFIIVDTPEQFKPDYWNRVVAIFTTGQAWQFKPYKWPTPQELFRHTLGVYVGWRDEKLPENIKNWGRGVASFQVEKWRGEGINRWRDREVVEGLWGRIEETMKGRGWGSGGPGR